MIALVVFELSKDPPVQTILIPPPSGIIYTGICREKVWKKMGDFQEKMLTANKQECNTAVKSHASVAKSSSKKNSTESIKEAVAESR